MLGSSPVRYKFYLPDISPQQKLLNHVIVIALRQPAHHHPHTDMLLWPARANTKIFPAAPRQPLADPIGWGFLRGVGEQSGLLSATARYCNLLQRK